MKRTMEESRGIALLRGINVGKAKRVGMADLRRLVEESGGADVRTLLNSGNVVFAAPRLNPSRMAKKISDGVEKTFGFSSSVVVLTADQLETIVRENPLPAASRDPAKYLVAFVLEPGVLTRVRPLLDRSWKPEAFALGEAAAYLWCARGFLDSQLLPALTRLAGGAITTRNWSTVLKLLAASRSQ